jgi:hypothetical protein
MCTYFWQLFVCNLYTLNIQKKEAITANDKTMIIIIVFVSHSCFSRRIIAEEWWAHTSNKNLLPKTAHLQLTIL